MTLWPFILRSTHNRILGEQAQAAANVIKTIQENNEEFRKLTLDHTTSRMADAIRTMDQLIFQMSQCTDWPSMRPHFNKLQAMTTSRMREESNRIRDLLIPEMKKVYTKENDLLENKIQ